MIDERQEPLLANPRARRRRRRKLGSRRELPSGRVEVRVRVTLPSGQAHTLRRVCEAANEETVRAQLVALGREYRDGLAAPELSLTLAEYQLRFMKGRSWSAERESTWRALRPLHGYVLREITDSVVSAWCSRVLYRGEGRAPRGKMSRGYFRHCFELLRILILQAVADRVIHREPCSSRPPGVPTHGAAFDKRRTLTAEELSSLFAAAHELDGRAATDRRYDGALHLRLWFFLAVAARPHVECSRVRREWLQDAHRVPGAAFVPGAGVCSFPPCKGGHAHLAPLAPELYKALLVHWSLLPEPAQRLGLLFPVKVKGRWQPRQAFVSWTQWKTLCERAGVKGVVLYQLRHTRLSDVSNNPRLGPRAAQGLAGHKDLRTTQTYMNQASTVHIAEAFSGGQLVSLGAGAQPPTSHAPAQSTPSKRGTNGAPIDPELEPDPPSPVSPPSVSGHAAHKNEASSSTRARTRTESPRKRAKSQALSSELALRALESGTAKGTRAVPPERAPDVPAERARLAELSSLVQRDGLAQVCARLEAALPPLDRLGFARELVEEAETCFGAAPSELAALAELVAARARAAAPVASIGGEQMQPEAGPNTAHSC